MTFWLPAYYLYTRLGLCPTQVTIHPTHVSAHDPRPTTSAFESLPAPTHNPLHFFRHSLWVKVDRALHRNEQDPC